jgi:hypothetical protein
MAAFRRFVRTRTSGHNRSFEGDVQFVNNLRVPTQGRPRDGSESYRNLLALAIAPPLGRPPYSYHCERPPYRATRQEGIDSDFHWAGL